VWIAIVIEKSRFWSRLRGDKGLTYWDFESEGPHRYRSSRRQIYTWIRMSSQLQPICGRTRLPVGLSAAAVSAKPSASYPESYPVLELSGEVSAIYPPGSPQDIRSYPPGYPLLSPAPRDHHVTLSRDILHKDSARDSWRIPGWARSLEGYGIQNDS
jgi:hypothetical protein